MLSTTDNFHENVRRP